MNLANDPEFVGPPAALGPWVVWRINEAIGDIKSEIKEYLGFAPPAPIDPEVRRERIAIDAFLARLSVFRVDVANVISVTFESEDPNKAAKIANAIAEAYLAANLEAKAKSTQIANKWLQDRLNELKVQAIEADRALQDYKIVNNLFSTGKDQLNSEQILGLKTQLANARMAMVEVKARFERIQKATTDDVPGSTVTDALNNSVIQKLRTQYLELAGKAVEIGSHVGPTHTAVLKLHERMAELHSAIQVEEQRIAGSYAGEYQVLKARESELASTIAKLTGDAEQKSQAQVTMRDFESSAETFRQLYSTFLQKLQEMSANQTQAIAVQDGRIVTRAAPPLYSNTTRSKLMLAGGVMLGLFSGFGLALMREWVADVFRSPQAVEYATGLKCVVLPMVKPSNKPARLPEGGGESRRHPWKKLCWMSRSRALLKAFAASGP